MNCRTNLVPLCLTVIAVLEGVVSIAALGHRHAPSDCGSCHAPALTQCCGDHEYCSTPAVPPRPVAPGEAPTFPEESCAICRHLAQIALPLEWTVDPVSQELVEAIVPVLETDVASPDYLLPEPRSPPVCA